MAYELKTRQTEVSVDDFLGAVPDPQRREDAKKVCAMMARLSGHLPKMWGPSIVGFGRYRYTYDSGHSGEMARIGFSPRRGDLVLYLSDDYQRHRTLMDRLKTDAVFWKREDGAKGSRWIEPREEDYVARERWSDSCPE